MGGMTANVLGWLKGITPGSRSLLDASARRIVTEVEGLSAEMAGLSDAALRRTARSLSYRAKAGEPIESLMVESFAATREAGRRANGMRHYDVQLLAGVALVRGAIVEMQTGEGKTLVATLPLALYALCGKGAHLATVNDYLAKRDAEWMEPIYSVLGMSVGIVQSQMGFDERREAYAKDVTYGTAKEFGFDFLKDRLMGREIAEGRGPSRHRRGLRSRRAEAKLRASRAGPEPCPGARTPRAPREPQPPGALRRGGTGPAGEAVFQPRSAVCRPRREDRDHR